MRVMMLFQMILVGDLWIDSVTIYLLGAGMSAHTCTI